MVSSISPPILHIGPIVVPLYILAPALIRLFFPIKTGPIITAFGIIKAFSSIITGPEEASITTPGLMVAPSPIQIL